MQNAGSVSSAVLSAIFRVCMKSVCLCVRERDTSRRLKSTDHVGYEALKVQQRKTEILMLQVLLYDGVLGPLLTK